MTADLRLGRWQDVLADVAQVDAVVADPPYGERTHRGNSDMARVGNNPNHNNLSYAHWTPADIAEFVASWSPRCTGWMACFTSHDLIPAWQDAYEAAGRYIFAPVPCLQHRPRFGGDGPGSGTCYLMVARPRKAEFAKWGSLPCWYGPVMAPGSMTSEHIGGKPMEFMLGIIRDYTRPGDLVADPCAGGATTAVACHRLGRRFIGAEVDPVTYAKAAARLDRTGRQQLLEMQP